MVFTHNLSLMKIFKYPKVKWDNSNTLDIKFKD